MKQWGGVIRVLLIVLIKPKHERLNHQVSKSVSSCGKHVGDAGIHIFIITRIGGKLPSNEVWTNNVEQVISESKNLKTK